MRVFVIPRRRVVEAPALVVRCGIGLWRSRCARCGASGPARARISLLRADHDDHLAISERCQHIGSAAAA